MYVNRLLVVLLVSFPAFAATHTWTGATSELVSDPSNWSGGSPVGDPEAVLVFPAGAARLDVNNDVPNLPVRSLQFQSAGYRVSGQPLAMSDATITGSLPFILDCDITIAGTLEHRGRGSIRGAISGPGRLLVTGVATLSGTGVNTYTGGTVVRGNLDLNKLNGATAVPGSIVLEGESISRPAELEVLAAEQIADSATIDATLGRIRLFADETVHRLRLRDVEIWPERLPKPTLAFDVMEVTGQINVLTNLRFTSPVLEVPAGASLSAVEANVIVPAGGITLRGGGSVGFRTDTFEPITIEGAKVYLLAPNSAIVMTSGTFQGIVKSITATGGTIQTRTESLSDIRLGPAVTLSLPARDHVHPIIIRLNGVLELGGASLEISYAKLDGPSILIENASTQPVSGTFAGVPEGGTVLHNTYIVTYRGGSGNDVAITEVNKPVPTILLTSNPDPALRGEPVTLTVTIAGSGPTPTGSVFLLGSNNAFVHTAPLIGGSASLVTTIDDHLLSVFVRYEGDTNYARVEGASPCASSSVPFSP